MWVAELAPGLNRFFQGVSPQQSLAGWERVRWGMGFDEVQRYYPEAQANQAQTSLKLTGSDVQLPWSISFGFDSSRQLESVSLSFAGSREIKDFATLRDELNRRLGPPVSSTETSATWRRDDSEVSLSKAPDGSLVLSEKA